MSVWGGHCRTPDTIELPRWHSHPLPCLAAVAPLPHFRASMRRLAAPELVRNSGAHLVPTHKDRREALRLSHFLFSLTPIATSQRLPFQADCHLHLDIAIR